MIPHLSNKHLLYGSFLALSLINIPISKKLLPKISFNIQKRAESYQRINFYPDKIILVRHGQSEANINPKIYRTIPDSQVHLSPTGKQQALTASHLLKQEVGNGPIKFYVSPYIRTIETFEGIRTQLKLNKQTIIYDPRIREQELGNFHDFYPNIMKERQIVSDYYYRFRDGESGADVYNRALLFIDRMFRDFKKLTYKEHNCVVIVCHRWFMRAFITAFFNMNVNDFNEIKDAKNCGLWIIEKNKKGKYKLKSNLPRIKI